MGCCSIRRKASFCTSRWDLQLDLRKSEKLRLAASVQTARNSLQLWCSRQSAGNCTSQVHLDRTLHSARGRGGLLAQVEDVTSCNLKRESSSLEASIGTSLVPQDNPGHSQSWGANKLRRPTYTVGRIRTLKLARSCTSRSDRHLDQHRSHTSTPQKVPAPTRQRPTLFATSAGSARQPAHYQTQKYGQGSSHRRTDVWPR